MFNERFYGVRCKRVSKLWAIKRMITLVATGNVAENAVVPLLMFTFTHGRFVVKY